MTDAESPRRPTDNEGRPRRPKDSEFFELPPDLKRKLAPGELPVMAGSTPKSGPKPKDDGNKDKAKGGCLGLLLVAGAGLGALLSVLA